MLPTEQSSSIDLNRDMENDLWQFMSTQQHEGNTIANSFFIGFPNDHKLSHKGATFQTRNNCTQPTPLELMMGSPASNLQHQHLRQQHQFLAKNMSASSSGRSMRDNQSSNNGTVQNAMLRRMSNQGEGNNSIGSNFGIGEISPFGMQSGRPLTFAFQSILQSQSQQQSSNSDFLALMRGSGMGGYYNSSSPCVSKTSSNTHLLNQEGLVPPSLPSRIETKVAHEMEEQITSTFARNICSEDDTPHSNNEVLGPWSAHAAKLLGNMMQTNDADANTSKKSPSNANVKKHNDRPKRPLSAYNIFFKEERSRILESLPTRGASPEKQLDISNGESSLGSLDSFRIHSTSSKKPKRKRKGPVPHGKIGFESLAKIIGKRWRGLDDARMAEYKSKAEQEMKRYKEKMTEYKTRKYIADSINMANAYDNDSLSMSAVDTSFLEPQLILERNNSNSVGIGMFQRQQQQQQSSSNFSSILNLQQQLEQLQQQQQLLWRLQQQSSSNAATDTSSSQGLGGLMTTTTNASSSSHSSESKLNSFDVFFDHQQQQQPLNLESSMFEWGDGGSTAPI